MHDEDRDGECGLLKSTRRNFAVPHHNWLLSNLSLLSRSSEMSLGSVMYRHVSVGVKEFQIVWL